MTVKNLYMASGLIGFIVLLVIIRNQAEAFVATPKQQDHIVFIGDSTLNNRNYVYQGETVENVVNKMLSKKSDKRYTIRNLAKDGATITDVYRQLDKLPLSINTKNTFIFISVGGNDILKMTPQTTLKEIMKAHRDVLQAAKTKMNHAQVFVLNVYFPPNPHYRKYKPHINTFNEYIGHELSDDITKIIEVDKLITSPGDVVQYIEPSAAGSEKIGQAICQNIKIK